MQSSNVKTGGIVSIEVVDDGPDGRSLGGISEQLGDHYVLPPEVKKNQSNVI